MTERGRQSWGWSNGTEIVKAVGELREGFTADLLDHPQAIIHTRHATFGSKTKENSHPFSIKGIIGVHNGMVYNHAAIAKTYGLTYTVDSEVIFHAIADGVNLSELEGYGAVAYWQDGVFHIGRFNDGDMELAQTTFGWVYASTQAALLDALCMAGLEDEVTFQPKLEQGVLYQLVGDTILESPLKLNISKSVSKVTWQTAKPAATKALSASPPAKLPNYGYNYGPSFDDGLGFDDDGFSSESLDRYLQRKAEEVDRQWAASGAATDSACAWCYSDVATEVFDSCALCQDCYATIPADDILAYETALVEQDEEALYARDNDGDASDEFVVMTVNYANFGQEEVICSTCNTTIPDNSRVYLSELNMERQLCAMCFAAPAPRAPLHSTHTAPPLM